MGMSSRSFDIKGQVEGVKVRPGVVDFGPSVKQVMVTEMT